MWNLQHGAGRRSVPRRLGPYALPALGCLMVAAALIAARPDATRSTPGAPAASTSPAAADPAVDYHDATAVCLAFARTLHMRDTTTDSGPADAYRRAAAYADARYGAAAADLQGVQLPDWQMWLDHRAYVDADVQPLAGDIDLSQGDRQVRAVAVTATAHGRDGWTGPSVRTQVVCDLAPAAEGWRVATYTLQVTP